MRTKLDDDRRLELLDGVMNIIVNRGFSDVTISDMANELHCSVSSLYKIASNKDGLVVLAIARWGELSLADMEGRSKKATALQKERAYIGMVPWMLFATSLTSSAAMSIVRIGPPSLC